MSLLARRVTRRSLRPGAGSGAGRTVKPVRPARSIFAGFFLAALIGTGALMLPGASTINGSAAPLDALFTAVSALCVTGLITVDTPVYWTVPGQMVILALIQLGGFGVMTFASAVGVTVVRRMSLSTKLRTASETKALGLADLRAMVFSIVRISLLTEGVVAVMLTARFCLGYGMSFGKAVWNGVFHAVSAFNNAGFALFSDSLIGFDDDPLILLPICAAIILGGLGFPVIVQLRRHGGLLRKWSMNTRIVLVGTAALLVIGAAVLTVIEWSNPATLGPMPWNEKLLNGFTQSVQTRTAGFNNLDISQMGSASWLVMDALMFIGGGPAGTAGGIKITTFAVLFFIALAEVRGDTAVNVFGKRLSRSVHRQAITVILMAIGLIFTSTVLLLLITDFTLDQLLFEVISAFATVGLSTGITADLPAAGQLILVALMFLGRLGPITIATALALRERKVLYELPKERPIIG